MVNLRNWSYELTAQEEAICVEVGYQRQKVFFGKPERNINYAEGDLWELWQHVVCAGSEMAFAKMLGMQDFVPHINKFKTELDIPDWGEVRYVFNSSKGLRFSLRDDPEAKYVLMTGGLANKNRCEPNNYRTKPYLALGWIYGAECMQPQWEVPYKNPTWYVPVDQLRSMPA